jgi:hypothetical protein
LTFSFFSLLFFLFDYWFNDNGRPLHFRSFQLKDFNKLVLKMLYILLVFPFVDEIEYVSESHEYC